jgi:nucleotide-binding universal stress UspA family protein
MSVEDEGVRKMSASLETILLATDGNEDSTRAALAAVDLSVVTGADLHVVHVWTCPPPPAYPGRAFDDYSRLAAEEAGEILRRQAWYARVDGAEVAGEHLRAGKPAEEITALAEELDADLVVLGSREPGWLKRLVTGSVSEGVVRGAPCPVLVVRATAAWPPTRIVVGDDGSGPAKRAGELAAELARLFGARILLVRAYENPPEPVGGRGARERRELDADLWRGRRSLDERAGRLAALAHSRTDTRMIEAKPALGVSSVADRDDGDGTLLAVGCRGLGLLGRAVSRSVSTHALRAARGPVLVVHLGASEASRWQRMSDDGSSPRAVGSGPESRRPE